jgi:4-hydroxythreonine-4-phosphate dehydrogenase
VSASTFDKVTKPVLVLTTGEPAGIGPDISIAAACTFQAARLVLAGDFDLLKERVRALGLAVRFCPFDPEAERSADSGAVAVLHVPLVTDNRPGLLDVANSPYVLSLLDHAIEGCLTRTFDAMVTAPVHKGIICDSGVAFSGHTEYLAERTGTDQVVMMLAGGGMRVALATTHLPLRDVPDALTQHGLSQTLKILHRDLVQRHGIPAPRIIVSGLNPHAGESGHLGREEIEVIDPVLNALRREGMNLVGPLPADTLFQRKYLDQCDCVLAMYHDQGLTVLKHASFGRGVNVTLGLPIIRTSVDHGTALELAGSGKADHGSMLEAIRLAAELVMRSRGTQPLESRLSGPA